MSDAAVCQSDRDAWVRLLQSPPCLEPGYRFESLAGKRVLITGAAGSIGFALSFAAMQSESESLLLLDTSESGLYELDRSLRRAGGSDHQAFVGSVGELSTLDHIFNHQKPHVVLHAAAYKHVPLMEQNPAAAILNNALGTLLLAQAAAAADTEALVLVSTDKAVDPVSIMGASKRIAELALLAVGSSVNTRMAAVRLGNVIGTQGSVLPLFREQLARGGPLTVTHPEARRYWMTMSDAVKAIVGALQWPESPAILAPDMGSPLRILDLARQLIESSGSSASILFTGLRPGDKMHESLLAQDEHWRSDLLLNSSPLRAIESPALDLDVIARAATELRAAIAAGDCRRFLRAVLHLVPGYRPSVLLEAMLEQVPA